MPRVSSVDGLPDLLNRQLTVASRQQLLALGMRDNAMQYRLRAGGPWQTLLPGVYLAASGVPSFAQKEVAALLYAGPGSLITGPAALTHHRIRNDGNTNVIDVLIPAERRRESTSFVKLHRTTRIPVKTCSVGPARLVLAPRAVADTARLLPNLRDVRAVVAEAVQLGRCTVMELAGELSAGPIKGSAQLRSVLAEVADGIRSTAEGDLRSLIKAARLPMPLFNPSLYDGELLLGKPDAWWPRARVAVEVDSRAWHLSPEDWDRTRRRHDLMGEAGIIVLHFSPRELRHEPAMVTKRIQGALAKGLARHPLPIRTVPVQ
ncbi:MAG TPA: hypothetical protein VFV73_31140 [Streptosporangiaceae bacterium]|nr:hypothetical protein [Streptosporangiaceae bacterium]